MVVAKDTTSKTMATPVGMLSFPFLSKRDVGRQYSDDKYKTDLLIPKAVFAAEGMALKQAVLDVAKAYLKQPDITWADFAHPFKDTDKLKNKDGSPKIVDPRQKGMILIRCKTKNKPLIVGPTKKELNAEQVAALKGGDWARLVVWIYGYGDKGVTMGLNLVQFSREGEAFGGGAQARNLDYIDEMEVPLDDVSADGEDVSPSDAFSMI